jgi:hypothetical protein
MPFGPNFPQLHIGEPSSSPWDQGACQVTPLQCVALQAKDVLEVAGPTGFTKSKFLL